MLSQALLKLYICYGGSAKYTWPLDIVNPLLELKQNITEGHLGCSYQQGLMHETLNYTGIHMTGSSYSYIDVAIGDSISINDFALTMHVMMNSATGFGTIFHYKVDAIAVDPSSPQIKDMILWNNETHLIAETFGSNDELYSITVAAFEAATVAQNWIGICVSHFGKRKTRIFTETGNDTLAEAPVDAYIKQPAKIRFGSSFHPGRISFNGNIICANMYSSKDCRLPYSFDECTGGAWPIDTVTGTKNCTELKGYFKINRRDVALDNCVMAINNMTTSSTVKCADLCLRTELCCTFTLNKLTMDCKIYDSDYSKNIVPDTGSNYYMRRDVCC